MSSRRKLLEAGLRYRDATARLDVWYRVARKATWQSLADVRKTFSSADLVGSCTVFNIRGNEYRLITWIHYQRQKIFIRYVLTHSQYDKEDWKGDCTNH